MRVGGPRLGLFPSSPEPTEGVEGAEGAGTSAIWRGKPARVPSSEASVHTHKDIGGTWGEILCRGAYCSEGILCGSGEE
jgi:hypothetical protein